MPKTETAPAVAAGPYRNDDAWALAHGTAVAAYKKDPVARQTVRVLTHLAWRAPGSAVAWHAKTDASMVAHADTVGATAGTPLHEAMAAAVATLPAGDAKDALTAATVALAPAKKK